MSLFRKRGPSSEDVARENEIKRSITQELSAAIRSLQRENHQKNEAILSTESANTVCNVLEAIFLHGLKDSVTKKLVSYISLNQSDTAASEQTVNFWQFASRFTHSDVTAQLKRLGQITTEVGLCRAWIRVALNDCLMESYVDSMLADKKTLEYFYHRLSYLRDLEQPEIFKSYLKGLMSFEFQLSYNSRLLNTWTNSPLMLSGIIQADNTPLPVIHPDRNRQVQKQTDRISPEEKYSELDNGQDFVDVRTIRTKSRSSSSENETAAKSSSRSNRSRKHAKAVPNTPPNTPYSGDNISAALTRNDVEEIRKLRRSSSPHGTGTSDSSHISCPDPVQYNRNPTAYIESKLKEENVFQLCDEQEELLNGVKQMETLVYSDIPGLEQQNVLSSKPAQSSQEISPNFNEKSFESIEEQNIRSDLLNERILQEILNESDPETENIPAIDFLKSSGLPSSTSTSNIFVKDDNEDDSPSPSVDNNNSVIDNKDHVIKTCDKIPTKPSKRRGVKTRLKPDFSPPNKGGVPPELSTASAITIETTQSRSPRPKGRLSMPDIKTIEVTLPSRSLGVIEAHSEPDLVTAVDNSDAVDFDRTEREENSVVHSPNVGNSLGARSGWSSSFDLEAKETVNEMSVYVPNTDVDTAATENHAQPIGRPKTESFGTMLQNYTPSSSGVTSPSLEDVLHNLPEASNISPVKHRMSPVQANMEISSDADEYEIVSAYSFPSSYSLEKLDRNMENKLSQISELATEKGLDSQNYQCGGCKRPIGLIYGKPRVCSFDGVYYCFECHENDEYYIPASIIHNWDFRKHLVSKQNLMFLQDTEDQAVINVMEVNQKLYEHVKEMEEVHTYRSQLVYLKTYLFTCKQSIAEELRKSVWPKEYMYDNIHMYSLSDLLQVPTGQLQASLKKIIKFATKHVYECRLCSQKGFICELCSNPQVIYPFQVDLTVRCPKCKSVFHKSCKTEALQCPKCQRREMRKSLIGGELQTPDINDYAYSPHR